MEQTVYIDLYFIINFSMDLLCFFITSRLLSQKGSALRMILAAALGGAYACVALLFPIGGVLGLLIDIAAGVSICFVAVKKKGNLKETAIYSLVYSAVCIVMGGFMTVLFSFFNKIGLDKVLQGDGESDGISVWLFALLAVISGFAALIGGKFFRKKSSRVQGEVEIRCGEKSVKLKALCDSGNLLKEPISGKSCIVVDRKETLFLLPDTLRKTVIGEAVDVKEAYMLSSLRIIPTATVGGEGILYAIKADSLMINMGNGKKEVDAFVAFGELDKNKDGIKALVPSELAFGLP